MAIRVNQTMPLGGLRLEVPPDKLEGKYSPSMMNVRVRDGRIVASPGRANIASGFGSPITWIGMHSKVEDKTWTLALGSAGLFRWGDQEPSVPRAWFRVAGPALTDSQRFGVANGEDKFFFCSLTDGVFYWDGNPASPYVALTAAPKCRFVEYFNNRLLCANVKETSGAFLSNRIRYSVNGNFADWTGNGSGFVDFWEPREQAITGLRVLGGRCAVYRENSISDLIPTGTLTPVFQTETRVVGIGTKASWTVASAGLMHFFLGSDRLVRAWSGTSVEPIGESILANIAKVYDASLSNLYFGIVSYYRQEYWLVLNDGMVFIFDYVHGTWTYDRFESLSALGEVIDTELGIAWDSIPEAWNLSFRVWNESQLRSAKIFGGRQDGITLLVDDTLTTDYKGGVLVPLDSWVETGDLYFLNNTKVDPWETGTVKRVLLTYDYINESPTEVGVSYDRGQSWITANHIPISAGVGLVDFNSTGRHVRFRFRNNKDNGRPSWRDFSVEYVPGGPYNPPPNT